MLGLVCKILMCFAKQEGVVGVTTGQLLCACVGSDMRSEYTVYGDAVNLSARLMVKAASGLGSVLCDYTTHQLGAAFVKPEPIKVGCSHHACSFRVHLSKCQV